MHPTFRLPSAKRKLPRATPIAITGLLLIGFLPSAPAHAAPATTASPETAARLVQQLGDRSGGVYPDANGRMVVTVTDEAAARQVRAAGAIAKIVKRGMAELNKATAELEGGARVPGTAWWIDPVSNQVIVSVDSTVTGAKLERVNAVASRTRGAVQVIAEGGLLTTMINGGDAIYSGGFRCSLGFNVHGGQYHYFLTAGHCTNDLPDWYSDPAYTDYLGPRTGSSFPSDDYGIVRHEDGYQLGIVNLYNGTFRHIDSWGPASIFQSIQRSGSTTGVRSGIVTGLNVTVNYTEGTVRGLTRTTACAEPGDSGGPFFRNTTALGLLSGGSGNCTSGGKTYFQPITEVLDRYGVHLD